MWFSASAIQSHRAQLRMGGVDRLSQMWFPDTALYPGSAYRPWQETRHLCQLEGFCYKVSGQRHCRIALGIAMGTGHTSLKLEDVLPGQLSLTGSIWTIFYISVLRLQQHYVYPEFFSCSFLSQPRET